MDNTALARFITSLGSLNNYGSTVLQTKKALDLKSTKPLRQDADDIAIFNDALKGIKVIKETGLTVEGMIAVNKQFDSPSQEQPSMPGHLRNAYYNSDDRICIVLDETSQEAYIPPEVVTKKDLEIIVNEFKNSDQTEADAWKVFARISKLQPFQDGNKRTALIAANAALDTFESEQYLVLPFNDLDRAEFTINLMRFYKATTDQEENAFDRMLRTLPSGEERELLLTAPIEEPDLKTKQYKSKPQFRGRDSQDSY